MSGKRSDKKYTKMPMLPLKGIVVFPGETVHFETRKDSLKEAVEAAISNKDNLVFLAAQNTAEEREGSIYTVGTVAEIRQTLKIPDGDMRVIVEGLYRAKASDAYVDGSYCTADVKPYPEEEDGGFDSVETDAVMRCIKKAFEDYIQYVPRMPSQIVNTVMNTEDPRKMFEALAFNITLSMEDKQALLEENCYELRISMLLTMLARETEVMELENHLHERVREHIEENQREYYLREQMRAIQEQLSGAPMPADMEFMPFEEEEDFEAAIKALKLPEDAEKKLLKENDRMMRMPPSSQDYALIRTYLDTVLELPWNKSSEDNTSIDNAQKVLDNDHYGLEKVKDRILENIAVRALVPDLKGQIICLSGPPGVGKTSIGRSIAAALGRQYVRVSLGGVRDEADIRGHRKTYVGAMPGRIINAISRAGTNNPLIMLDEIDKMTHDMRGDPSAALLEVLDGEQNVAFRDHYIEVPFDLSKVLFIATANSTAEIDPPLLDRMDVIELSSYTREEKFNIARKHLVPKQIKKHGLKSANMKIADSVLYTLIDSYTKEAGVRSLERRIGSLCRKAAKEIVSGDKQKVSVTARNLESYLGHKKFIDSEISSKDEVGTANGLAWTSVGGVMLPIEAVHMEGKGSIETTGSLGDVMKESAKIAVSYVRTVCGKYGIAPDFYKTRDIHIHAPEGATPKDGPSAGVTMTTALISALSGIPVRHDVAMTGEITLHGKVLPIGGLREKTMAAYKEGMKTVIVPKGNMGDLDEVDDTVKEKLNFVFAEKLSDVLDTALVQSKKKAENEVTRKKAPAAAKPGADKGAVST